MNKSDKRKLPYVYFLCEIFGEYNSVFLVFIEKYLPKAFLTCKMTV